jgi:hypothetical protein
MTTSMIEYSKTNTNIAKKAIVTLCFAGSKSAGEMLSIELTGETGMTSVVLGARKRSVLARRRRRVWSPSTRYSASTSSGMRKYLIREPLASFAVESAI